MVKRLFHFVSAVSFAPVVLSFLFRSQGMLLSFGGEIGKLIKAPQGGALERQSQEPISKFSEQTWISQNNSVRHCWERHDQGQASQGASSGTTAS